MTSHTQIGARELEWFKRARRGETKRQRMLVRAVQEALPVNTSSNRILILESDLALARKKTRMLGAETSMRISGMPGMAD